MTKRLAADCLTVPAAGQQVRRTLRLGLPHKGDQLLAVKMAAAYRTLPGASIPGATTASQISVRVGTALGAALIAVVLQSLIRSGGPGARAYTGGLWWTFAIAGAALVPVLLIPRR
ncbi:hypothetical protein ACIBF6_02010 [Streptosporangium amethystogenes]|uniref:hypothetical protein n=1 Tax=Streptosporangium amethystogenes TaxID=2002 RepID=UPI0037A19EAD